MEQGGSWFHIQDMMEVNLMIPQFPQYKETILMLVILDSQYTVAVSPYRLVFQVI